MSHLRVMNEAGIFSAFTIYQSSITQPVKINLKRGTILQLSQHILPKALWDVAIQQSTFPNTHVSPLILFSPLGASLRVFFFFVIVITSAEALFVVFVKPKHCNKCIWKQKHGFAAGLRVSDGRTWLLQKPHRTMKSSREKQCCSDATNNSSADKAGYA